MSLRRSDAHHLRIMDALVQMLTNPALSTEDVIEVLDYVHNFVGEQLANARREQSPG